MKNDYTKVRVYDFQTERITEIPACELGPQMVKARIEGMDGEFFVDITKSTGMDMTRKYDPPPEFQKAIRHCMEMAKDVDPRTYDQHEMAFCAECNPPRALVLYFHCLVTYRQFSKGKHLDQDAKNELWAFILNLSFTGGEMIFHIFPFCHLKRSQAKQIIKFYGSHDPRPEFFRLFDINKLDEEAV